MTKVDYNSSLVMIPLFSRGLQSIQLLFSTAGAPIFQASYFRDIIFPSTSILLILKGLSGLRHWK